MYVLPPLSFSSASYRKIHFLQVSKGRRDKNWMSLSKHCGMQASKIKKARGIKHAGHLTTLHYSTVRLLNRSTTQPLHYSTARLLNRSNSTTQQGSMSGGFRTRTQRLRGRDFYHGMIQRADVDELLRNNGDYLLRKTENSNQLRLALSVYWKDQVRHFIIQENDDEVYFEDGGPRDQDVESLIKHIARKRKPVTKQSGVMLKRAIPREDWVLTHESITLNGRLGAGQFGEVSKGLLKTASGQELDVAVKTLRDASVENQKSFLSEARTMRQLRHDNVVRIYGVAVYEKPFMICMEHCGGGSLLHHLRTRHPDSDIKLRWVTEAAKGLEYIANQGLVHRDIAARNCLLTEKELRLKIADFGLTIQQATAAQVVQGKMPIKWLAKETMELGIYNKQTDIWSYAILCWEVYSDGAEPYPGMTNLQARTQILLHGHRMDIPKCAPTKVAALIQQCWNADARERPAFTTIVERLTRK